MNPAAGAAEEWQEWLRAFEAERGRPLRILHIGNIANNAYNNARIQRQFGIAADVACHDYYHVMGCPEWEDADFVGDVGDPFFPDWWAVDLRGFRRPPWFAQGRTSTTQRYLIAWSERRSAATKLRWRLLAFDRWARCRSSPTATIVTTLLGIQQGWGTSPSRRRRLAMTVRRRLTSVTKGAIRTTLFYVSLAGRKLAAAARAAGHVARGGSLRAALVMIFPTRLGGARPTARVDADPLANRFAEIFPDRTLHVTAEELAAQRASAPGWKRVLDGYDIVQGYSTDPIIPLLCGVPSFAAYEHGTLREIPFEETARGDLCALCYREASVVFVTNSDVLPAAERLGLTEDQIVCLPHAVDSAKLFRFATTHPTLAPSAATPTTLFSPTRHDWVIDDPNLNKGNDRLLEALAQSLSGGLDIQLVLVRWGRDVNASISLAEKLGISSNITWIDQLDKRQLWARYLGSHAVADQFATPAIGGVTFEALALGRRVVTALDVPVAERFFGAAPPLFPAREVDEIATALQRIAQDPLDSAGLGRTAHEWFSTYHSAERIVALQVAAYARMIDRSAVASPSGS